MQQSPSMKKVSKTARRLFSCVVLSAGLLVMPGIARAQSATIYGALSNFDVVNNTGQDAHGFEIYLQGVQPPEVLYTFSGERYGAPVVSADALGTYIRYLSPYDPSAQGFTQTTVAHAPGTGFAGTCYQWYPATYNAAGCEHFGAWVPTSATKFSYRWLVANPQAPGTLVPWSPIPVASATYLVAPPPVVQPAAIPPPAVVVAEVQAPEPAPVETPQLYGDAQWMKVFVTQLPREVTLDELLTDNPLVVPMDPAQIEVNWDVVQADPVAGASNGKQTRARKRFQGGLDPTTRSVVRRIELYNYTGAYNPLTHEAICADLNVCATPSVGELGDFVSAQMTAVNVQADTLTITKAGSGLVESSDKRISCGSKCVSPYTAGSAVTLSAKAASGSVFTGWTGACAGTNATCTLAVNGRVVANANFAAATTGGGGGGTGGGGGGSTTTQFTVSVGRSNPGAVTGTPVGTDRALDCGNACSAKFNAGTLVTLTATPPAGKLFVNWGGACSGTAAICTVTVNSNLSVQANFSK